MSTIAQAASTGFLIVSMFFFFVTTVGLFRFRTVYARLHIAGKCLTGGALSVILAYLVVAPTPAAAFRLFIAMLLLLFTSALGTHAITRSSHHAGVELNTLEENSMAGTAFDPRPRMHPDASAEERT